MRSQLNVERKLKLDFMHLIAPETKVRAGEIRIHLSLVPHRPQSCLGEVK